MKPKRGRWGELGKRECEGAKVEESLVRVVEEEEDGDNNDDDEKKWRDGKREGLRANRAGVATGGR